MNDKELAIRAEEARRRLLAQPRETVWQSIQKEPFGSVFIMLLIAPLTAIPYAILALLVEALFGLDLWDHPAVPFMWLLSPLAYSIWVNADNEKKFRARQKHLKVALPTGVAKTYCETFPRNDELWPAMDYLWREGRARSFEVINSMMLDSLERARQAQDLDKPLSDGDSPRSTPH